MIHITFNKKKKSN